MTEPTTLSLGDRTYWLLSFTLGGFAAWLFDYTSTRLLPSHVLLGLMLGRMPRRVETTYRAEPQ